MKKNKNIYQDTLTVNGKINLTELARLTLLNILSVRGVIYTHYKNKRRYSNPVTKLNLWLKYWNWAGAMFLRQQKKE